MSHVLAHRHSRRCLSMLLRLHRFFHSAIDARQDRDAREDVGVTKMNARSSTDQEVFVPVSRGATSEAGGDREDGEDDEGRPGGVERGAERCEGELVDLNCAAHRPSCDRAARSVARRARWRSYNREAMPSRSLHLAVRRPAVRARRRGLAPFGALVPRASFVRLPDRLGRCRVLPEVPGSPQLFVEVPRVRRRSAATGARRESISPQIVERVAARGQAFQHLVRLLDSLEAQLRAAVARVEVWMSPLRHRQVRRADAFSRGAGVDAEHAVRVLPRVIREAPHDHEPAPTRARDRHNTSEEQGAPPAGVARARPRIRRGANCSIAAVPPVWHMDRAMDRAPLSELLVMPVPEPPAAVKRQQPGYGARARARVRPRAWNLTPPDARQICARFGGKSTRCRPRSSRAHTAALHAQNTQLRGKAIAIQQSDPQNCAQALSRCDELQDRLAELRQSHTRLRDEISRRRRGAEELEKAGAEEERLRVALSVALARQQELTAALEQRRTHNAELEREQDRLRGVERSADEQARRIESSSS